MKVLIISNMYPNSKGSYRGIFVKNQLDALEKAKIDIIKVVKTQDTIFAYIPFILRSIFYLFFESYDLVHAHYGFHSALFAAIIKKRPFIITFHGGDALVEPERNRIYYKLQRFVVSRSNHIIAVSNEIKSVLISKLGADPNKISVVTCGIDTSVFVPLKKNKVRGELKIARDARVILFVGGLTRRKGVDIILECAQRMPDILFILVGEGKLKMDIENCKSVGVCPNNEICKWMNVADIFILPSRSEGTPLVVLEALSCGIPVIASDVGGISDVIKNGENGYLVPADNINLFQDRIMELLNNEMQRKLMGKNGRKDAIEKFNNKKINYKIIQIYKRVII